MLVDVEPWSTPDHEVRKERCFICLSLHSLAKEHPPPTSGPINFNVYGQSSLKWVSTLAFMWLMECMCGVQEAWTHALCIFGVRNFIHRRSLQGHYIFGVRNFIHRRSLQANAACNRKLKYVHIQCCVPSWLDFEATGGSAVRYCLSIYLLWGCLVPGPCAFVACSTKFVQKVWFIYHMMPPQPSLVPSPPPQLSLLAVWITRRRVIRTASDDSCDGGLGTRLAIVYVMTILLKSMMS